MYVSDAERRKEKQEKERDKQDEETHFFIARAVLF